MSCDSLSVSPLCTSYPQDEADGGHARRGHDFGTVGHEVEQRGHDALRSMVKLVTQDRGQMSVEERAGTPVRRIINEYE